jgi:hypothetical protein
MLLLLLACSKPVPAPTCGAYTLPSAEGCVVAADACGPGTRWSEGRCLAFDTRAVQLAPAPLGCGPGTVRDHALCVPKPKTPKQLGLLKVVELSDCQLCSLQGGISCQSLCPGLVQGIYGYKSAGDL